MIRSTQVVQLLVVPILLLCFSVSDTASASALYYTDVSSAPGGSYVCGFGTDFPNRASATVYLDTAKTCTICDSGCASTFTTYTQSGNTVGTADGAFCFEMPADASCATINSLILNDGASDSNTLFLARHSGTTYWVDDATGSDSNSCRSSGNACLTIRGGANKMSTGDALVVRAGTYDRQDTSVYTLQLTNSGTSSRPLTYRVYPGETATINNDGTQNCNVTVSIGGSHIQFAGFATTGRGNLVNGDYARLSNNNFSDANADNCWTGHETDGGQGVFVNNTAQFGVLIGNDLNNNGYGADHNYSHGLYLTGDNWTVAYNEASGNARGMQNYDGGAGRTANDNVFYGNHVHNNTNGSGAGILVGSGARIKVFNNVVHDNEEFGIVLRYNSPIDIEVFNNTIYRNGTCIALISASGSIIKNNICRSNTDDSIVNSGSTGTVSSNNLISIDPLFTAPATGDFSLQAGSPAIDAGTAAPSSRTLDFESKPAPIGGIHDIGAYEHHQWRLRRWFSGG